ncbi:MAG: hypothetical protein JST00_27500 [Deltaproteobacteria bacterium]|nr:hypothetical protein [Deltaproteobacteria bacterium]
MQTTLERARRDAQSLFVRQRALFAGSLTAVGIVAVRGLVAIARPHESPAPLLAMALGVVLAMAAAAFAAGLRARRRMERVAHDIQALELLLDAALHDTRPEVEARPYRLPGDGASTFVIRTDALTHAALRERERAPAEIGRAAATHGWAARTTGAVAVLAAVVTSLVLLARGAPTRLTWTFLEETTDPTALGFAARAGAARAGEWLLADLGTATGARALVNRAGDATAPPATLLVGSVHTRDVRATTRCKVGTAEESASAGEGRATTDGCGLVFRYRGERDHHVARLDFSRRRLVVARVTAGKEHELGAVPARIDGSVWQELDIVVQGDRVRAVCNRRDVVDVVDPVAVLPGAIGLWAPSASEAHFDELSVESLAASPQALEMLPLLGKGSS